MRFLVLAAFLFSMVFPILTIAAPARAVGCQFVLGFAALHETIPDVIGECSVDVHYDAIGDARQETTAWHGKGGLLYWRKADNWTGFTDGYHTWMVGPSGVEKRLNTERFAWESDRLVPALRNAEYRLPFGLDPRSTINETIFRLTDGVYESREQRMRVLLHEPVTASGDLNGDGVPDAVALLVVSSGGSGVFEYAVAMLDQAGEPVQAGYEFLGDRVKVNRLTIANCQITVDVVTHGPNEPLCCPTQHVVKPLGIQVPSAIGSSTCGTSAPGTAASTPLEGARWKLESYVDAAGKLIPVLPGSTVTAEFGPGRVSGKAGCNGYTTAYQADGSKLKIIGPIATTRMMCASPAGVMDQEAAFMSALASASSYRTTADKLEVARADGSTVLTFTRQ